MKIAVHSSFAVSKSISCLVLLVRFFSSSHSNCIIYFIYILYKIATKFSPVCFVSLAIHSLSTFERQFTQDLQDQQDLFAFPEERQKTINLPASQSVPPLPRSGVRGQENREGCEEIREKLSHQRALKSGCTLTVSPSRMISGSPVNSVPWIFWARATANASA